MSATGWDDEGYRRRLEEMKQARALGRALEAERLQKLVEQLTKFKVCPCVAMGRYSTCCQPRNDK